MQKDIPIDPSGNAPDADLYRANHDTANWINNSNVNRVVKFPPDNCPFDNCEIPVPARGQSGPQTPNSAGDFHYSIPAAIAANEPAADPNLIVH